MEREKAKEEEQRRKELEKAEKQRQSNEDIAKMLCKKRSKKESTIISDKNKMNSKIIENKKLKVEKESEPTNSDIAQISKAKESSDKVKSSPITLTSFFKKSTEEMAVKVAIPPSKVEDNAKTLIEPSKENCNSNSNLKQPRAKAVVSTKEAKAKDKKADKT